MWADGYCCLLCHHHEISIIDDVMAYLPTGFHSHSISIENSLSLANASNIQYQRFYKCLAVIRGRRYIQHNIIASSSNI